MEEFLDAVSVRYNLQFSVTAHALLHPEHPLLDRINLVERDPAITAAGRWQYLCVA